MLARRSILAYQAPRRGAPGNSVLLRRLALLALIPISLMLLLFLAVLIPYLHIDLKFQALHRSCVVGATTQKEVRDKLGWFHESSVAPATNLWGRGVPPGGWVCEYKHAVTRESFQVYYDAMGRVHGLVPTYE